MVNHRYLIPGYQSVQRLERLEQFVVLFPFRGLYGPVHAARRGDRRDQRSVGGRRRLYRLRKRYVTLNGQQRYCSSVLEMRDTGNLKTVNLT